SFNFAISILNKPRYHNFQCLCLSIEQFSTIRNNFQGISLNVTGVYCQSLL
ncbi:hypothetical protein L9F63_014690, partial [Diploptera punctata]